MSAGNGPASGDGGEARRGAAAVDLSDEQVHWDVATPRPTADTWISTSC